MRRLTLGLLLTVLIASTSSVSSLVVPEPCSSNEVAGDNACAPTCATCGCCARATEPGYVALASSPSIPAAQVTEARPRLVTTDPHDILHVPKSDSL